MKDLQSSGLFHYLQIGIKESGLDIRGFLKTKKGKELAIKYGFSEDYYIDNIISKYEQYI